MVDILSYNAIIDGCCKKGKMEKVENPINILKKDGLLPNFYLREIVCTMLLDLCSIERLAFIFL